MITNRLNSIFTKLNLDKNYLIIEKNILEINN